MSDITALREILADGDTPSASTPAPEPLDGVPQESVSAEPETEEEGDELSAEERVAALAREGMDEADAEPDPEDVAADAGDPEPDEQE